jgi:hypothetical protein
LAIRLVSSLTLGSVAASPIPSHALGFASFQPYIFGIPWVLLHEYIVEGFPELTTISLGPSGHTKLSE